MQSLCKKGCDSAVTGKMLLTTHPVAPLAFQHAVSEPFVWPPEKQRIGFWAEITSRHDNAVLDLNTRVGFVIISSWNGPCTWVFTCFSSNPLSSSWPSHPGVPGDSWMCNSPLLGICLQYQLSSGPWEVRTWQGRTCWRLSQSQSQRVSSGNRLMARA